MPEEHDNCEVPIEVVFDAADTSGRVRFLGLSREPDTPDHEPTGLFDWTCQACGAANQDSVILKPHQKFSAQWTCDHCSRVTFVSFRARSVAEWIVLHTTAVAGNVMHPRLADRRTAVCGAGCGKHRGYSTQRVLVWVVVATLTVVVALSALDMRRVSKSSAALQTSVKSVLFGTGQKQSKETPSGRIVGYWISESQNHVMCFSPIDPVSREGAYAVVWRGGRQPDTVQFKVIHEDTAGEELVIRKEQGGRDTLPGGQKGADIARRLQSEPAEVTFNVAKSGKSMTRVEVYNGEPVTLVYFNASDSDEP